MGREYGVGRTSKKLKLAVELSKLRLNCQDCDEHNKIYRGCNGGGKLGFQYEGKIIDHCPVKLLTKDTGAYIQFYNWYKKGFLALPGTIAQQPVKLMEALSIIESHEIEMENKRPEEMLR